MFRKNDIIVVGCIKKDINSKFSVCLVECCLWEKSGQIIIMNLNKGKRSV